MDPASQLTVKRKFDVAFVITKEHLPFMKMKPLCELEERMILTSSYLWTTKIISLVTVHTVIRNYTSLKSFGNIEEQLVKNDVTMSLRLKNSAWKKHQQLG